jgi:hypothetical protein
VSVRAAALLIVPVLFAGCASPPPARTPATAAPGAASVTAEPALEPFGAQQRALARSAMRNDDATTARRAWALVLALAPQDAEARAGHAWAVAALAEAAREQQRAAEQARARGDNEAAMRAHLRALSFDPALADSAAALRRLEAVRLPRTSFAPAPAAARTGQGPGLPDEAAWLLSVGDSAGALRILEPLAAQKNGGALRPRVCELLLARARELQATDPAAAQAAASRCLKLLPQHAATREWQRTQRAPAR